MNAIQTIVAGAMLAGAGAVLAQGVGYPPPANVLQLSTTGTVEVQQDLLVMNLNTVRDGADATSVQNQLKLVLDAALTEAKKAAVPGQMEVRTGNFGLYPRYTRDGKINGWQGSAELVLEGRDFARISATAARLTGMTLGHVGFNLSREQRAKVEAEAQTAAIDQFKAKAAELAKSFGFAGYTLREVAVNANDQGYGGRPRMMTLEAKGAAADMPVPVEAGKSTVMVTVSGTVQLK